MRTLTMLALAACTAHESATPDWMADAPPGEVWEAPHLGRGVAGPPPPQTLTLSMSSAYHQSSPYNLTVSGNDIDAGDTVRILIGRSPTTGRCFPSGLCTGVSDIAVSFMGTAAVPSGQSDAVATFSGNVPPSFPDGTYYVQAYDIRGPNTVASNIVTIQIDHCRSGVMRIPWDAQRVADCTSLPSLYFEDTFTGPASFPALTSLGSISADPATGVTEIDLPVLPATGRIDMRGAPDLTTFLAPALLESGAGETFNLRNSPVDTMDISAIEFLGYQFFWPPLAGTPDLPALRTVEHSAYFSDTPGMTALSLPSLEDARYLSVANNPDMVAVDLPSLTEGSVTIGANNALETIDLSAYENVRHWFRVLVNPSLVTFTHGPNPTVMPEAPSNAAIEFYGNGSWCYDEPIDWSTMTTGEQIDRCP